MCGGVSVEWWCNVNVWHPQCVQRLECEVGMRRACVCARPSPPRPPPSIPPTPPCPALPSPSAAATAGQGGGGSARRPGGRSSAEHGLGRAVGLGLAPRAGSAGAAAGMCRMSFKVSTAGCGRECRAERETCGGGPAPRDRQAAAAEPAGRVGRRPGAGGGQEEAAGLGWLLWFVVWMCGVCSRAFRY